MVTINNLEWNIVVENSDYDYLGTTSESRLEIHIASVPNTQVIKRTITHEVVHAYLYSYGFPKKNFNEEDLCEFIANNLDGISHISNQVFDEIDCRLLQVATESVERKLIDNIE